MKLDRVTIVQRDLIARLDRIVDLIIAYNLSGKPPDEIGREFYYAVGELTEGVPLDQLELFHIDSKEIEKIAVHGKRLDAQLRRRGLLPSKSGKKPYSPPTITTKKPRGWKLPEEPNVNLYDQLHELIP